MRGHRALREEGLYITDIPPHLLARIPAEQRGPGLDRDAVRLLVSRGGDQVSLHEFRALPGLLRAGDVLVVNTSATLAAAVDARLGGEDLVVHFSTRGDDDRWAVELRHPAGDGTTRPRAGGPAGAVLELPGGHRLTLEEPLAAGADRLWWARPSPGPQGCPGCCGRTGGRSGTRTRSATSRSRPIRRSSRYRPPTGRARRRCRARAGPSRRSWWRGW